MTRTWVWWSPWPLSIEPRSELIIAIPPEATRGKVPYWRSGFYHIARAAQVPIALGFLDYRKQVGGIGPLIHPSGDMRADMDKIRIFYGPMRGNSQRILAFLACAKRTNRSPPGCSSSVASRLGLCSRAEQSRSHGVSHVLS